jgi:hypothetical protein
MEGSDRGHILVLFSHNPGVMEENGKKLYRIADLRIKKI